MDEARLKAIEERHYVVMAEEVAALIAALREAWKVQGVLDKAYAGMTKALLQVEAEVVRTKDDLLHKDAVIKALQQQYVDHMRPLQALRDAAAAYMAQIGDVEVGATERDREYLRLWGNLSRALRVCEGVDGEP